MVNVGKYTSPMDPMGYKWVSKIYKWSYFTLPGIYLRSRIPYLAKFRPTPSMDFWESPIQGARAKEEADQDTNKE